MSDRDRLREIDDRAAGELLTSSEGLSDFINSMRLVRVDSRGRPSVIELLLPPRQVETAAELAAIVRVNQLSLIQHGVMNSIQVEYLVERLLREPGGPPQDGFDVMADQFRLHVDFRSALAGDPEGHGGYTTEEVSRLGGPNAEAERDALLDHAIRLAEARPDMAYVDGRFLHSAYPESGAADELLAETTEDLKAVIDFAMNQAQAVYVSTAPDRQRHFLEPDTFKPPPPIIDDEPFIGGIPASYRSKRLIPAGGAELDLDTLRQRQDLTDRRVEAFEQHSGRPFDLELYQQRSQQYGFGRSIDFAGPVHREWDQWGLFADGGAVGRDPAYVDGVTVSLIKAGYLSIGDVAGTEGHWTNTHATAAKQWLFEANLNGMGLDPFAYLEGRAEAKRAFDESEIGQLLRGGGGGGGGGIRVPAFTAPDYATLAQGVKQSIRQKLGRDPHDYEIELLAEQMSRDFRAQYDAEVQAMLSGRGGGSSRPNHTLEDAAMLRLENAAAGRDTEEGVSEMLAGYGAGGGGGGGTVQGVDPWARLSEAIEQRFATEIDRNKAVVDTHRNTRHMMGVLAGLEQAVG